MHTGKTLCLHSQCLRDGGEEARGHPRGTWGFYLFTSLILKQQQQKDRLPQSILTLSVCIGTRMSLCGGADAEVGAGDTAIAIMYNWTIYTQCWLWNHTTVYRLHLQMVPRETGAVQSTIEQCEFGLYSSAFFRVELQDIMFLLCTERFFGESSFLVFSGCDHMWDLGTLQSCWECILLPACLIWTCLFFYDWTPVSAKCCTLDECHD